MNFSYTDQQKDLRSLVYKVLEDYCSNKTLKELENSNISFHRDLWHEFAKTGFLGTPFDKALGGSELGFLEVALIVEQIGYRAVNIPFVNTIISAGLPIAKFGSENLKQITIPKIITGDLILSVAIFESLHRDLTNPNTTLEDFNGIKLLSGQKNCVPYAKEADFILVPSKDKSGELFLIFVDSNSKGLQFKELESTTKEPQYSIELDKVKAKDDLILASGSKAKDILDWLILRTTAALCSFAVGISQASLDLTKSYTSSRLAFNRPIASFQAVAHRAADCYIDIACLRAVTEQAISLLDLERDSQEQVSIAKIWCGDVAHRVSHAAQHLHGGIGVDRDYNLFRYCLWAKQLELTLGSSKNHLSSLGKMLARSN